MKKIINAAGKLCGRVLKGIYDAHGDQVKYVNGDLRCYCTAKKKDGKVAIITGGGTGHLPLFLGYVGEGLLDGCASAACFSPLRQSRSTMSPRKWKPGPVFCISTATTPVIS